MTQLCSTKIDSTRIDLIQLNKNWLDSIWLNKKLTQLNKNWLDSIWLKTSWLNDTWHFMKYTKYLAPASRKKYFGFWKVFIKFSKTTLGFWKIFVNFLRVTSNIFRFFVFFSCFFAKISSFFCVVEANWKFLLKFLLVIFTQFLLNFCWFFFDILVLIMLYFILYDYGQLEKYWRWLFEWA